MENKEKRKRGNAYLYPSKALDIIKQIAISLELPEPKEITGNASAQFLLSMLNRSLQHCLIAYDWQALIQHFIGTSITITALNVIMTADLPLDFMKMISKYVYVNPVAETGGKEHTAFRKFTRCSVEESFPLGISKPVMLNRRVYNRFYIIDNTINLIFANVDEAALGLNVHFVEYFYKSSYPVYYGSKPVWQATFDDEDDKSVIDTELLILGAVMFYMKYVGKPYEMFTQAFNERLRSLIRTESGDIYDTEVTEERDIAEAAIN
jgi:hypothetical protein